MSKQNSIRRDVLLDCLKRYLDDYEVTTEHDSSMANVIEWLETRTENEYQGESG